MAVKVVSVCLCVLLCQMLRLDNLEWGTLGSIAELGFSGFLHEVTSDDVVVATREIFSEHRCNNICQLFVCSAPTLLTLCRSPDCS